MKHLEGVKKDRKSDDNTCMEMAETKANIEERILEFIESSPEHNGNLEEVIEWCKK